MNYRAKKAVVCFLLTVSLFCASGCSGAEAESGSDTSSNETLFSLSSGELDTASLFTSRDKEVGYDEESAVQISLKDDETAVSSEGVSISGNTVTITQEGVYLFSGSLSDGQIIVDAEKTDKIQLVLNNVSVSSSSSAAVYIKQADKVFLTTASGSVNTLSSTGEFHAIDENKIDAAVFSKDDLTLNGAGSLVITSEYGHGTVSKDDLVITSGSYTITSAGHALSGKDSVRIADGNFSLTAGKDGIHAENTDDASLGFVYLAGGDLNIICDGDGIDASSLVQTDGGTVQITSGGGSANASVKQEELFVPDKGETQSSQNEEAESASTKGIKADSRLLMNGGIFTIDSADDSLHSNGSITVAGGEYIISTGDDGIHADENVTVSDGCLTVKQSYEGIEGQTIDITGGAVSITASDDGLNSAGGNDQSGFSGGMTQDRFAADSDCYILISGGNLYIDASGDGIDSNGSLTVSGGETFVDGPENGGNGALDYNGEGIITGSVFIASGMSQMAQNFTENSTQGAILLSVSSSASDREISLTDESGTVLLSYTPQKSFDSIVLSAPQIKQGETYTLTVGDVSQKIEMTSLIYGAAGGNGGGVPNTPSGGTPPERQGEDMPPSQQPGSFQK